MQELIANFPMIDVKKLIKGLAQKGAVELLDDHVVKSNITKRQFSLYDYRVENGFNNMHDAVVSVEVKPQKPRNPFDFDMPTNPFDFDTKPQKSDSKKIDEWLDSVKIEDNPLFVDLKKHVKAQGITDVTARLDNYTIIPEFLVTALEYVCQTNESGKDTDYSNAPFPNNPNIFKFEIIEEYIKNNDYDSKELWSSSMQDEYDRLKAEMLFPESIMAAFKKALDEVQSELTLSNIREIKKIIAGNS